MKTLLNTLLFLSCSLLLADDSLPLYRQVDGEWKEVESLTVADEAEAKKLLEAQDGETFIERFSSEPIKYLCLLKRARLHVEDNYPILSGTVKEKLRARLKAVPAEKFGDAPGEETRKRACLELADKMIQFDLKTLRKTEDKALVKLFFGLEKYRKPFKLSLEKGEPSAATPGLVAHAESIEQGHDALLGGDGTRRRVEAIR